jgi:hypothetical protein
MSDRKYPIHGAPGVAWLLIYEAVTHRWVVETLTVQPRARTRLPLEEFERTETGRTMAIELQRALERAQLDA